MLRLYRYLLLAALAFALISAARAQDLKAWRGAWIADVDGARHVLYLVLRDDKVSGFHCFDCSDPGNLSFVDDGTISVDALNFSLYHSPADGAAYVEQVKATLTTEGLSLTLQKQGSAAITLAMHRAPPQQVPPPVANARPNQPSQNQPRTLPGTAETVTTEKVLGLWLWGVGPTKQYFFFKRHKDGIRGMVCGPCDSAQDFAPLENISMNGTNFHFEIVHEDNGIGFEKTGPFSNVTDAKVVLNEMHMDTRSSVDPNGPKYEMTLLGPVQYMPATRP